MLFLFGFILAFIGYTWISDIIPFKAKIWITVISVLVFLASFGVFSFYELRTTNEKTESESEKDCLLRTKE